MRQSDNKSLQEKIRLEKLKEVSRMKRELELRLSEVNKSIHSLSPQPKENKEHIPDTTAVKTKEYLKERKHREKALEKRLASWRSKQEESQEHEKKLKDEELSKKIEERRQKAIEFNERSLERREKIKSMKEEIFNTPKKKPLYLKMEKNYQRNFVLPELDNRKNELMKKHQYLNSIEISKLRDFANEYDYFAREKEEMRQSKFKNTFVDDIPTYKHKDSDDEITKKIHKDNKRKELSQRQKWYGKLVKQMYVPEKASKKTVEEKKSAKKIRRVFPPKKTIVSSRVELKPEENVKPVLQTPIHKDFKRLIEQEEILNRRLLSSIKDKVSHLNISY